MEENEIVRRRGVTQEEWARMLALSNARRRRYHKGEAVLRCGDRGRELGLVEQGSVNIETVDLSGSRSILGHIPRGQVFAETYAFCQEVLMVDVTAAEESQILFLNIHALLLPQYAGESWQRKLLTGLLAMSTQKNLALSRRMFCVTPKTVRGRLTTYLAGQAALEGRREFSIPFDRQQLADYLNLDRSALSRELSRMQEEGLLEYHKNRFKLTGRTE